MSKKKNQKSILFIIGSVFVLALFFIWMRSDGEISRSILPSAVDSGLLLDIRSDDLHGKIKTSRAKVKLVNIWATWCGPCIEEFPALLKLRNNYKDKGLELYFVSADMHEEKEAVLEFLGEQDVDFETYLKDEDDQKFITALNPDWSGALPATFIYNEQGELANFWTGDASYEEFEERVTKLLNDQKGD